MTTINVLLGLLLLLLGRQLYWLFVGGLGFVTAVELVTRLSVAWPNWLVLLVAVFAGITGALLAIFLQEAAVGIAGFLAGGFVALGFLDILGAQSPALTWIVAVIVGVTGLILAIALFDWALIILSSLTGASLLVRGFAFSQPAALLVFVLTTVAGIIVQARAWDRTQHAR
ncbi:MAG: hypothetical protein JXC32_05065 [Anaerolineae bacterium]|nr:hypothetical protein [Anaerolineae bacterium]